MQPNGADWAARGGVGWPPLASKRGGIGDRPELPWGLLRRKPPVPGQKGVESGLDAQRPSVPPVSEKPARIWRARALWAVALIGWIATSLVGLSALALYSSTSGAAAQAPARWPAGSTLTLGSEGPTLLVFSHPRCSCTRATVYELARLLPRLGARIHVHAVVFRPKGVHVGWEDSDLLEKLRRLPSTEVRIDRGGLETSRFGGLTSGQVLLYDSGGALVFEGGITPGRSHTGDNAGSQRIAALVRGEEVERRSAPVFGCAFEDAELTSFLLHPAPRQHWR